MLEWYIHIQQDYSGRCKVPKYKTPYLPRIFVPELNLAFGNYLIYSSLYH